MVFVVVSVVDYATDPVDVVVVKDPVVVVLIL